MGKHRIIQSGDVIEHLEIIENLGYREYCGKNTTYWKCRCTRCGKILDVPQKNLGKSVKDCGCWRNLPRSDIRPGMVFGRLKVVDIGDLIKGRGYTYLCECGCDNHTRLYVMGDNLKSVTTKSCGCLHDELFSEKVKKAHRLNFINDTSVNKIMNDNLQKNNTSGIKNVYWHKVVNKWYVTITYKGIRYNLGYYSDKKQAQKIADSARKHVQKDFEEWYSKEYPDRWEKMKNKRN